MAQAASTSARAKRARSSAVSMSSSAVRRSSYWKSPRQMPREHQHAADEIPRAWSHEHWRDLDRRQVVDHALRQQHPAGFVVEACIDQEIGTGRKLRPSCRRQIKPARKLPGQCRILLRAGCHRCQVFQALHVDLCN